MWCNYQACYINFCMHRIYTRSVDAMTIFKRFAIKPIAKYVYFIEYIQHWTQYVYEVRIFLCMIQCLYVPHSQDSGLFPHTHTHTFNFWKKKFSLNKCHACLLNLFTQPNPFNHSKAEAQHIYVIQQCAIFDPNL